jgi:hypothetical protein
LRGCSRLYASRWVSTVYAERLGWTV